jgi:uncharacterized protein (TIGR00725 family)
MTTTVAVFGASGTVPGDAHYEEGIVCGRSLAEAGYAVATGGYYGTMEAVSLGARSVGGTVVGVTAPTVFPRRPGANDHVTDEWVARSLVDRIGLLIERTDASIALWGSLGTATELLVAWNLAFVASFSAIEPKPVIAVGEPWTRLVPLLEEELSTTEGLVRVVPDVQAAVGALRDILG